MSQNKEIYGIRKRKVCGACSVLLATACFAISMGASVSADEWATSNPSELKVVAQEVDYTDEILGNSPDILSESQLYQGYQEGLVFSKAGISDTMIPHDGSGIVIATVDSGVDETHKIMRLDPTAKIKLAPQSAEFSDKIPFRYDFLSGDTDLADDSTEHGMHIVGVLVGNEENGFKGMAPNAQLLAYRTWSEDSREGFQEDYQFYAIEDALAKGADIISLSIGEVGSGRQDDVWYDIVKKAKEKDVIITAAMGNYGTAATTNSFDKFVNQAYSLTDDSTIVSLAANPDVLAVGSYYDTYMKLPHFKAWGMSFAYEDLNWHNYDLFKRKEQEEITFNDAVLYWNKTTNDNIKDKIVLIDRNQEKVFDQVLEVMKKDPKGIIMINAATPTTLGNYESIPEIRSATLDDQGDYFERIWAVSVSYKDGQLLKKLINQANPQGISFDKKVQSTRVFDYPGISGFSSWGASPDLGLKPDLVAPGENIWSTANKDVFFNMSGTSMASPYVAGASTQLLPKEKALLQKEKALLSHNRIIDLNKIILQNTADILKDHTVPAGQPLLDYSPRRQGAGALNIDKALKTKVLVTYEDTKGAVDLKAFIDKQKEFTVVLKNFSDKTQGFEIDPGQVLGKVLYKQERKMGDESFTIDSIHSRIISQASVGMDKVLQLAPHSSLSVIVKLDLGQAKLGEFVEGFIRFKSTDKSQPDLNIPYMGFYGDWNAEAIVDPPGWDPASKTKMTGLMKEYPTGLDVFDILPWGVDYDEWKATKDKTKLIPNQAFNVMQSHGGSDKHAKMRIRLNFMRHAQDYQVDVVTSQNKEADTILRTLKKSHYPVKYMESAYREYPDWYYKIYNNYDPDLEWDGGLYDPKTHESVQIKDGNYYIRVKARLTSQSPWQYTYMPFKVDNKAPEIKIDHKSETEIQLKVTDENLHYVAVVTKDSEPVKLIAEKDGLYKVNLEDYKDRELRILAIDYGENKGLIDINGEEMDVKSHEALKFLHVDKKIIAANGHKKLVKKGGHSIFGFDLSSSEALDDSDDEDEDLDDLEEDDEEETESGRQSSTKKDTSTPSTEKNDEDDLEDEEDQETTSEDDEQVSDDSDKDDNDPKHFESGGDIADSENKMPGLIEANSSEVVKIEEDEKGNHFRIFKLHVRPGQRVVVTATNAMHNLKTGQPITESHWSQTYTDQTAKGQWDQDVRVPIFEGSNTINVSVFYEGKKIFARGYGVKLDTKIPDLKIDNKNIDFIADWKTADSDDGDEVVGTIRTRDGMVNLAGTIEDLQDGWFLYINDNMVDNVVHLGEFGQQYHNNKRNWTYSQQMAHNDYVKLKVEDNMKNAKEYIFKVIVDPEIKDELPLSLPMKKSESKKVKL